MTLVKTSILSFIATTVKVLTGLVSVKIIAIYIGPTGMAMLGQFQNFVGLVNSIASLGMNSGIVKYTAEYRENIEAKKKIWSSAIVIFLFLVVPMALGMMIFSKYLSLKLMNTEDYYSIFIIFACTLLFFVFSGLITSILNGEREIKKLVGLNILASLVGIVVTVVLVYRFRIYGALIAGIISQSIVFFIALLFVRNLKWFSLSSFIGGPDREFIIKLLKYSMMMIVAAVLGPLSQIYLRNYIVAEMGWDAAGYWQGIWRISNTYLMVITMSLGIYYLPRLSGIKDKTELKKEIVKGYKFIMPVVIVMAIGIYFLRDFIIVLLFDENFRPMSELFFFQLIGDILKMASWLLSYLMVAKAMTKLFVLSEIFFVAIFVTGSIFFMKSYGLIGITMGFALNYLLYLVFIIIFMRKYLNAK